jgi:hypothetical protein
MEWSRGNTVPDMSFGRPGDVLIVDTTDAPSNTPVKDTIPEGVGIWMKLPLSYTSAPTGNIVIGFPAGKSTLGDIISINGANVTLTVPNTVIQAVADILGAGIPNITAVALGEAVMINETSGGAININDITGSPSLTLGLYTRASLADDPANGAWVPLDFSAASATGAAPLSASFLTLAANASLGNERVLTAGPAIKTTDGGAGQPYTIEHDIAGVTNVLSETLDPAVDKILIHNDSTNQIERTTLDVLLTAPGTVTAAEAVQQRSVDINITTPNGALNVGAQVPANSVIRRVSIEILTTFIAGTNIKIGDAGNQQRLMTTLENDPTSIGIYETLANQLYSTLTQIQVNVSRGGGLATGSARIIIDFVLI